MSIPNVFHSSKWKCTFSNIPTLTKNIDINLYDLYVKSLTIPSYSLDILDIHFKNSRIISPNSKANFPLEQISIEFKCDEELNNYYNLFEYMQELRYGQNSPTEILRLNTIKKINVEILDNQKKLTSRLVFTEAIPTNLSSLNLNQGADSEVGFSVSFAYEEVLKEEIS